MGNHRKLKVGILGCGPIAQAAHLEACQKAKNAYLHSVCDQDVTLADKFGTFYQAECIYYKYEDMLADPDLEAVVVAVSDEFHLDACSEALKSGKHVLVEKPLGDNLEKGQALLKTVKDSGLILQVGHMKRFDPGISFARNFISTGIGALIAYKGWYADSTHRYHMTNSTQPVIFRSTLSEEVRRMNRSNPERYYLMAHGSHLLDTASFLVGNIISVRAKLKKYKDIYSWFIDTEFESGCLGHLDLTVAVRMDWHEGFQIYGEQGSVLGKIFNPWYFKTSEVQCFNEADNLYIEPLDNNAHFYQLQLESFASAILDQKPQIGTDIHQGLDSIRAMIAVSESVHTGQRVKLSEVKGSL